MENIQFQSEIQHIYDDYISDTSLLEAKRKPTDGLLGFGNRPDSDPCHSRFADRLEQTLNALAAASPSSQTVNMVLHTVYEAPISHMGNILAYWMLQAVHGLTDVLIRFLSTEDAADMSLWYEHAYPKNTCLPVQKRIAAHLRAQAGGSSPRKRKGLFDFFRGEKQL